VEFGGVDLQIGSLTEVFNTLFNVESKFNVPDSEHAWYPMVDSWGAIRELIASVALKVLLKEKAVQEHGLKVYFNAESIIGSLTRVAVTSQQTNAEIVFTNFNLIDILPTRSSLGLFGPASDTEQIVDNLKLLIFKIPKGTDDSDSDKEKGIQLPEGPAVVLQNNYLHNTFEHNELLVLEYAHPGPFVINHVMVKSSRISKNPVKHAFFWAFDEKPTSTSIYDEPFSSLASIATCDENDHLVVKWPPLDHKPGDPFAHVEIDRHSFYGEAQIDKAVTGRYIAVSFADNWESKSSKDKATVQYVGFVGPAEKPIFKNKIGSKFGVH